MSSYTVFKIKIDDFIYIYKLFYFSKVFLIKNQLINVSQFFRLKTNFFLGLNFKILFLLSIYNKYTINIVNFKYNVNKIFIFYYLEFIILYTC